MKKKEIIFIIILMVVMITFFIIYQFRSIIFKSNTSEEITLYQEWYDMEVADDEDVFGYDIEHTPAETYISINNIELVYDNLTIQAISTLRQTCEDYLFHNGYPDARTLTVIEDSITGDKSYFTFCCSIEEYPNTILSITYILNDKTYILSIK